MAESNRRIVLSAYPQGRPTEHTFRLETTAALSPSEGEFLVRNRWLSVDPMIRIFIDERPLGGASPALPIGTVIPGPAVAEVVESRHPDFAPGDLLEGRFGWQDYAVSKGQGVRRVDASVASAETALGVLGLPGFSAYVGLHLAGEIQPGQTVLVSGAAGAVGSVVGPLARARGARTVAIARGKAKQRYLIDELGYDAVIDWSAPDRATQFATALPGGADVYFDNVGGGLFPAVLPKMNRLGRVIICGLMAQYDDATAEAAPRDQLPEVLLAIMRLGLTIRAFSNTEHEALRAPFLEEVGAMVRAGAMPTLTHVETGLERTPAAFARLFEGGVTGKLVVKV
ncbi:MAG: NADP-dependent oxidoreductase [Phenylobacterium sp.]|nr:NADP-dependent oxidoreductase [Phenylobacterium sp.]